MPNFVPANQVMAALGLERETLHRLNPALLPSVWNGSRHVPRGYELRVPASMAQTAALDRLSGTARFEEQVVDTQHRVRKGESLASIAGRYGVSQARLAELNDLRRPYRIRAGQVLNLPGAGGKAQPATPPVVVAAAEPPPKPVTPSTGVVGTENRYVVKRGDTLSRIATKNGMTEEALMELNSIRNRNFVFEGQILALNASARVAPPVEAQVPIDSVVPPAPEPAAVAEAAEPESEREADELGPTLIPGAQSAQSADPGDYSVHDDNTIRVQAAETVGHFADWLEVRASQVRQLNRMSFATPVVIGHKLKLDFSKVTRDEFEAKRAAYHKQLQENFFTQFRITGDETHVIKSGESIWVLVQQRYNIPIWLLRQYNPDLDMGAVKPGTKLIVPTVESIVNGEPAT
jgi:membrane-bound lytic murein transglycosylase D